jgi:asparagine synthase (glutamine-hydrolysing)
MDFSNYLAEDILVKVDRASMMNSLEVRSPFLDKDLIEFAFNKVPSNLKANSTQKKILLKRLSCKLLPKDFDRTRKQGFQIPLNDWLKQGKYRDFFYNVLLDSNTIFDKKIVLKLFKYQDLGMNNGERLFALVMFELWRRQHNISI